MAIGAAAAAAAAIETAAVEVVAGTAASLMFRILAMEELVLETAETELPEKRATRSLTLDIWPERLVMMVSRTD